MSPMEKVKKNKNKIGSLLTIIAFVTASIMTLTITHTETVSAAPEDYFEYYLNLTTNSSQIAGLHDYMPCLVYNDSITVLDGLDSDDFSFYTDGGTELDWELVQWNDATDTLEAWVNVSSLDYGVPVWIHLWYEQLADVGDSNGGENNPESVWDTHYVMVQHMTGGSATAIDDSTSNNNDVDSALGTPDYNQVGQVGNSTGFDGSENLEILDSNSLSFTVADVDEPFTWMAWINGDTYATTQHYIFCKYGSTLKEYIFRVMNDDNNLSTFITDGTASQAIRTLNPISDNTWVFATATYDGREGSDATDGMWNFINGTNVTKEIQTDTGYSDMTNTAEPFNIGSRGDNTLGFDGEIDEVHLSDIVRSDNYIMTQYNMMNNLTDFWIWTGPTGSGSSSCTLTMLGAPSNNYNFTLQGEVSNTVYANSSGTYYETGEFNFTISGISYFEFLRINVSDITDNIIDGNDIYLSFDDDNSSWSGNWHQCSNGGETIWVNGSEWTANNWMSGTNPFTADSDADGENEIQSEKSIFMRVRIDIPADATLVTHSKTDMTWDAGEYT